MARKKCVEIVLDVETTGLDYKRERIIEFAAVRLENGVIKDKFETLINPKQHIRKSSMAIHGITEEMVADAPVEEEIMPAVFEFIGEHALVAHNAIFDYNFINEASKRLYGKAIENQRIDSQVLFKEVYPEFESHGLENLMIKFGVEFSTRHRAMADAIGLAEAYPKLKKLYEKKYDWQMKQVDNIEYLFERFLRIQQAVQTMQAELQDLKSIFKLYFDEGGKPVVSMTGEKLVYQSKQSYTYDFIQIKDILEELGALPKAVKLNNGFVDRLLHGKSLDEETREKLRQARCDFSETRNVQIIKPDKF
jgi:DNA polymerase III epsilon subunit family exonuclease